MQVALKYLQDKGSEGETDYPYEAGKTGFPPDWYVLSLNMGHVHMKEK